MILDATCGNRVMWKEKQVHHVVYMDKEKELRIKPTIVADLRKAPFRDKSFQAIFFDPPYYWGSDNLWYLIPDAKTYYEKFGEKRQAPRYYGVDKFASRSSLISAIYYTLKEFHRVLQPNGLLWLKWCEVKISLDKIFCLFLNFTEMLRLVIGDPLQTHSDCQTYWICFLPNKPAKPTLESYLTIEQ